MTAIRAALGVFGLLIIGYGAVLVLDNPWLIMLNIAIWAAAGVILHDFVFAPLCVALGFAGRRLIPRQWWVPIGVGALCSVILLLLAVPAFDRPGARPDNHTVLDRNYPLGLGIALAVVWVVVPLYIAASHFASARHRAPLHPASPTTPEGTDMTTAAHHPISDQVAAMQGQMSDQGPSDVLAAFDAEQRDLDAAGVPATAARPGTPFPTAELLGIDGQPIASAAVLAGKTTVVVFYRGAWCPYCNIALRTYQRELVPALQDRGVSLVAISPQTPDGSLSAAQANELTFTVLSDPGNRIAGGLGILTAPSQDAQAAQQVLGLNLRAVNADGTVAVPMPTVAIVDGAGVLQWIDVHPNYTTRTEPDQILAALDNPASH